MHWENVKLSLVDLCSFWWDNLFFFCFLLSGLANKIPSYYSIMLPRHVPRKLLLLSINSSIKNGKKSKATQKRSQSMRLIIEAYVLFKSTSERHAYQRAARSECPAALGAASGWWCRRSHPPSSAPPSPETASVPDPPGWDTANRDAEAESSL